MAIDDTNPREVGAQVHDLIYGLLGHDVRDVIEVRITPDHDTGATVVVRKIVRNQDGIAVSEGGYASATAETVDHLHAMVWPDSAVSA